MAVAIGDGGAGLFRRRRHSERPAGAKAAVTQGSAQIAGGGGWCRRRQWLRKLVATGGGKAGAVNNQGSAVARVRVAEKQGKPGLGTAGEGRS